MSLNRANIQMTGEGKQKKGFFGTLGSAAKDIGISVAAGSACGFAVGGAASLIPVKNKEGIKQELQDAFLHAARDNSNASYINNKNTKSQLKKAKDIITTEKAMNDIVSNRALKDAKKALKNAGNDKEAVAEAIKQAYDEYKVAEYGVKTLPDDYTKDVKKAGKKLLKELDSRIDNSVDTSKKAVSALQKKAAKFIEDFDKSIVKYMENASKDDELMKLAKKEAKRIRRSALVSNAVYVGVLSMLLMNLFSGFMPKRKSKEGATAAQNTSAAASSLNTTQA